VQTIIGKKKFSREFTNDDENEDENKLMFAESEQEKGMIRINKNLQKSAKNIIRKLFRKKGLRVIITLHSQLYTKSITPLRHP
jgi:hypothetical protein